MNVPFAVAGALSLVGALVHGVAGELLIVRKVSLEGLPSSPFGGPNATMTMIRATWHITTIAFAALGSALVIAGLIATGDAARGVGFVAAGAFTGFAVLTIALVLLGGPRSLLRHPGPILFVTVAVLTWWGVA